MRYDWTPELDEFRAEMKDFVRRHAPAVRRELAAAGGWDSEEGNLEDMPAMRAVRQEMEERDWLRMAWPVEYGGAGKSPWYYAILVEELSYAGIPSTDLSLGSVAPAIMNHGTEAQKKQYLPDILNGKMRFCIGYSEPNAGTDLASLQTRGQRDGDEWVINGQKLWTSNAQNATHVWLAARTDPSAPKHRGISMFIIPMNTPGVSIRAIRTGWGGRTNETFYENVRIPHDALVGEEGRGWYMVANALDHERVTIAPIGGLVGPFDELIAYLKERRPELLQDRAVRLRLAEMKVDLHVQRALKTKNAAIIANGGTPTMEASMTKVWSSELRYRLMSLAMDLLGRAGSLEKGSGDLAPLGGSLASTYMMSPTTRFGGGTNEVQRNIIAQRGLDLPR